MGTVSSRLRRSPGGHPDEGQPGWDFLREEGAERVFVVHNLGSTPVEAGPDPVTGAPAPLFLSPGVPVPSGGSGAWTLTLPSDASGVWRLR